MFVDIKWLKEWVEIDSNLTYEQLAKDLVKVGLEEEQIHSSGVSGPIVLGKVISISKEEQSNGKTINYCRVDVGIHNDTETDEEKEMQKGSRGIICGAHNFVEGDFVIVSLPGATLPGDFQIAARKTYGHISNGMICSSRELGLGDEHDGIIVAQKSEWSDLINKKEPGDDIKEELGLAGETLEINITPDRGYCFSYRGIAREFSHSTNAKFKDAAIEILNDFKEFESGENAKKISIELQDDSPINEQIGCTRFFASLIEGVDPKAKTPDFILNRLKIANVRSVSLPVDITNYVLMNFGQPLHAYDFDKLQFPIVVRRAKFGEKIVTLDEKERALFEEDLLICDSQIAQTGESAKIAKAGTKESGARAISIAGVMGGFETEVSSSTTNVFLESAWFDPISIARSARRHKLSSEASRRFERGVDPELQIAAGLEAVKLFKEYGGKDVKVSLLKNFEFEKFVAHKIDFKLTEVSRLLGIELPENRVEEILKMIGCRVKKNSSKETVFEVTSPSWRPDLKIPADLVEEIARINGYDEIPIRAPKANRVEGKLFDKSEAEFELREILSNSMAARGAVEVLSYPFVSADLLKSDYSINCNDEDFFRISNPLSGDKPFMRTSILQSLISVAVLNVKRQNEMTDIFETGTVFVKKPKAIGVPAIEGGFLPPKETLGKIAASLPNQPKHFASVIFDDPSVSSQNDSAENNNQPWKRAILTAQNLIFSSKVSKTAKITSVRADEKTPPSKLSADFSMFHPGRVAEIQINGETVGIAGELNSKINAVLQTKNASAFEINLDAFSKFNQSTPFESKPISSFPPVVEDFAFVVDESVNAAKIENEIVKQTPKELFEQVKLFDVFRSSALGENKKSLAFSLTLRSFEKTLENAEIAKVRDSIISGVKAIGGELRS